MKSIGKGAIDHEDAIIFLKNIYMEEMFQFSSQVKIN